MTLLDHPCKVNTLYTSTYLTHQVMKDISEVRKAMDTTQEMFEPLHQMVVMLKQHGVDVSGVQVAEKDVQVRAMGSCETQMAAENGHLSRFSLSLAAPVSPVMRNRDLAL